MKKFSQCLPYGEFKKIGFFYRTREIFLEKKMFDFISLFFLFFFGLGFFCRDLERRNKIVSFCSLASELIFFFVFVFFFLFCFVMFLMTKNWKFLFGIFSQETCSSAGSWTFFFPFLFFLWLISLSPDDKRKK